ncbi:MAG: hypothetical protein ACYDAD_03765 [Acidimicrobiales bacterium]
MSRPEVPASPGSWNWRGLLRSALVGLVGLALIAVALAAANGPAGLTPSQRRIVAAGRLLPVLAIALALGGFAALVAVRPGRRWPAALCVGVVGCSVVLAVLGPGVLRRARSRLGVTVDGRRVGPAVFDRGPSPTPGASLRRLEAVLADLPYGGSTNSEPPEPRLRDVRENVEAGARLVEVDANVNDHPDPALRRRGEWYDLATAARRLFQADPTIEAVDVTLWNHDARAYQARLTRQAAIGTGQLTADQLPQRWREEYRSPDW